MQVEKSKILENNFSTIWAQSGLFSRFKFLNFFEKIFNFFVIFQIAGVDLLGYYPPVSVSPHIHTRGPNYEFWKILLAAFQTGALGLIWAD